MRPFQGLRLWMRVDLGIMAMKSYPILYSKESEHQFLKHLAIYKGYRKKRFNTKNYKNVS